MSDLVSGRPQVVALERRLRRCPLVLTLGVRPNFYDYDASERALINRAEKIYYPSLFYAELFDTIGKRTFPSYHTYKYAQDKIKQTALFNLAGIQHPRTHVFYGQRQKAKIMEMFEFPLIAKIPRGSALGQGVFLIRSHRELDRYRLMPGPAYIQEYLPIERDIRVVVVGQKAVHAYWRICAHEDHRTNLGAGATVDLSAVPAQAIDLALETAGKCRWDDVGIDICVYRGEYYVLEGNMKYGTMGFQEAGIDYEQLMADLIQKGEI
jgi:ribosomal protein S6--L-glutamate ligase